MKLKPWLKSHSIDPSLLFLSIKLFASFLRIMHSIENMIHLNATDMNSMPSQLTETPSILTCTHRYITFLERCIDLNLISHWYSWCGQVDGRLEVVFLWFLYYMHPHNDALSIKNNWTNHICNATSNIKPLLFRLFSSF